MGKVDAWRTSSKACFAGGNVLICLKYLYNKMCEFCCQLNTSQGSLTQLIMISSLDPSLPQLTEAS